MEGSASTGPAPTPKRPATYAGTSPITGSSGRLHSPAQIPTGGGPLEEDPAFELEKQHAQLAPRERLARTRRRQRIDSLLAQRDAVVRDRAGVAARPRASAKCRAEIHQRLRVGRDVRGIAWQQRLGDPPQRRL